MNLAFLNIGTQEMVLIIIVILLLFGGKKLPELARGLGKGIRDFKDASEGIKREISDQINNFEKDLDVVVEEKPSVPNTPVDDTADQPAGEENTQNGAPQFTAPEGTYQHQPGREPDYDQQNYYQYGYNDHFAGEKPAEATPEDEDTSSEHSKST